MISWSILCGEKIKWFLRIFFHFVKCFLAKPKNITKILVEHLMFLSSSHRKNFDKQNSSNKTKMCRLDKNWCSKIKNFNAKCKRNVPRKNTKIKTYLFFGGNIIVWVIKAVPILLGTPYILLEQCIFLCQAQI